MPKPGSRFIGYPTDSLLAVLPDPEHAARHAAAAEGDGIGDKDITVLRGDEGASRFDPTGAVHGLFTRLRGSSRSRSWTSFPTWPGTTPRSGQARRRDGPQSAAMTGRPRRSASLARQGAHFVNYYGRFATEEIVRWHGAEPDIHSLLKR
jgi:hypothetical protein